MLVTPLIAEVRPHVAAAKRRGLDVGFVPTMGALHAGHRSLLERCRRECRHVVASIFVNPTQFGPNEDYTRYPRPLEDDLAMCRECGVDLVFTPDSAAMYPEGFGTAIDVGRLGTILEGHFRPGHFRGVATVVMKLFQIVQPDAAYFGQKDYQQQLLIRAMSRDLDVPVEIRTCSTVREPDGLALSSRNRYLTPDERERARSLSAALRLAEARVRAGDRDAAAVKQAMLEKLHSSGAFVDYATLCDAATLDELDQLDGGRNLVALVAARIGATRLIDNLLFQ